MCVQCIVFVCKHSDSYKENKQLLFTFAGGLLHELSNDGARQQFNEFLELLILPQMVGSARVSKPMHVIYLPTVLKKYTSVD